MKAVNIVKQSHYRIGHFNIIITFFQRIANAKHILVAFYILCKVERRGVELAHLPAIIFFQKSSSDLRKAGIAFLYPR